VKEEKRPRHRPIDRSAYPSWQFAVADWGGPFGWDNLADGEFKQILEWMKSIESLTWCEILQQSASKNAKHHEMPLDRIEKNARDRLDEISQSDIDCLFSFRISGPKRIWGICDGSVFKVLWWDPGHQVYIVARK